MNTPGYLLLLWSLILSSSPLLADAPLSSGATLEVGVVQSLTGIAAEDGNTAVRALRLAANEINNSKPGAVKLLIEDDASDPKQAIGAYTKLQSQGVDAIIGPTWSFTTNAVIPLAARNKLPLISTSTIPECLELRASDGFAFSTAMSVREHAHLFEQYLANRRPRTSVILYTNNSWGEAQRAPFRDALIKSDSAVLREIPSANFDTNDWRALLPSLKALQPNLWVLLVNKADLDTIIRQIRALGIRSPVFASYHFEDTLRLHPEHGIYGDVCYSRTFLPTAASDEFARKFRAEYGLAPQTFADNTYDTLFLLHKAFEEASLKRSLLRDALQSTTIDGVVGQYRFETASSFSTGKGILACVGTPVGLDSAKGLSRLDADS